MKKLIVSVSHTLFGVADAFVVVLVFCIFFSLPVHARITPLEGSKLNYRIIGFSFPANKTATQYVVEIADSAFTKKNDFAGHIRQSVSSDKNRLIAEVPAFGGNYTWRVVCKHNSTIVASSGLYHFSTGTGPQNGFATIRLRVKKNSGKYAGMYLLADDTNTMYDMNGKPVWYLPDIDSLRNTIVSDVKMSPSGTLTFLARGDAYELSYGGNILWSARNDADFKHPPLMDFACHHEFTKLHNGHYMALVSGMQDAGKAPVADGKARFFQAGVTSTLTEFDEHSNIVWSWKTSRYMGGSDLLILHRLYPMLRLGVHENAFYFDEKDSAIYISMAGISRIVKIRYPSGKVLGEYGCIFNDLKPPPANAVQAGFPEMMQLLENKMFSHQHAVKFSDDGFVYVFNNNKHARIPNRDTTENNNPQIVKMKESGDTLVEVGNFDCGLAFDKQPLQTGGGGGNIVFLPDKSLLVSMCSPYGDIFVVDTDKNILWSGAVETLQPGSSTWEPKAMYRASVVSREQLEQWIWHEQ